MIDPDARLPSQRDTLAERMLTTGCVLLIAPVLFVICAALWFGWPLIVWPLRNLF